MWEVLLNSAPSDPLCLPRSLVRSLTDKLGRNTRGNHLFDLEVQDDSLHNGAHVTPEKR